MNKDQRPLNVLKNSPLNGEALLSNLQSDLTSEPAFYVRNHFDTPTIELASWRLQLELDGKIRKSFSYSELSSMPKHTVPATLECAGNGRKNFGQQVEGEIDWGDCAVGTASWSGVSIMDLVRAANLHRDDLDKIRELLFVGADGSSEDSVSLESKLRFVRSLPVGKAMDRDTIIALEMNGHPLTRNHGFPARVIVPGWYAMASVKWLSRVILSTNKTNFHGHFNATKYVYEFDLSSKTLKEPITELKVKSLITFPEDGQTIPFGKKIEILGKAWSGFGKIVRVEVDTGGWKNALVQDDNGEYAWKTWRLVWTPEKRGRVTLKVRAMDNKGNAQPESAQRNRYLYGYNAIQKIHVNVV